MQKIKPTATTGIQNGEKTHHQDQSILLVSFNIKKIMNRIVVNPIPLLVLFDIFKNL